MKAETYILTSFRKSILAYASVIYFLFFVAYLKKPAGVDDFQQMLCVSAMFSLAMASVRVTLVIPPINCR